MKLKKLQANNSGRDDRVRSQSQTNLLETLNTHTNSNQNLNTYQSTTPNLKLSNTINSFINDSSAKNSNTILHNLNHLKEFYNLIFQAFNEKFNYILNENQEYKDCYKLIYQQINQFIEYKKIILQKFSKDSLDNVKSGLIDLKYI